MGKKKRRQSFLKRHLHMLLISKVVNAWEVGYRQRTATPGGKTRKKRNNSNNLDGITKAKLLSASNKGVISRVCTAPTIRMGAREEVKDGEENKKKLRIGRFWST